jgi:large subunit ribosomal protein L11
MVIVKLLVEGGKMSPGPAVAQQLGPMGINMGKVISDVNEKTGDFKGINVPVVLDINPETKEYKITVLSPPTSELIKKELGIETASGARFKTRVGNLAFEQVISVAKQKHDNMLSKEFPATVKSVLGTCQTMGVLVDSIEIKEVMEKFNAGEYDAIITVKKTDVDPEKRKALDEYYAKIKKEQDAIAQSEKDAEAAKK